MSCIVPEEQEIVSIEKGIKRIDIYVPEVPEDIEKSEEELREKIRLSGDQI